MQLMNNVMMEIPIIQMIVQIPAKKLDAKMAFYRKESRNVMMAMTLVQIIASQTAQRMFVVMVFIKLLV